MSPTTEYVWALARAFSAIEVVTKEQMIKLYQVFAQMDADEDTRREIIAATTFDWVALGDVRALNT